MKCIRDKKGMTLVEIVVSLAILGIMVVTFLSIFLGSYAITMRAESRSNTTALVAGEIDRQLASSTSPGVSAGNAVIHYVSGGVTNTIAGKNINSSVTNDKNQTILITYFEPAFVPEGTL
ncbi:MAG: type II secretion system protein [Peptostreptococcaceae bacterium]|nr:type II secretion system protein [Peptostreptococcaceae bacterium]